MEYCGRFAEEGLRVLVLAHSVNVSEGAELPEDWNLSDFCLLPM